MLDGAEGLSTNYVVLEELHIPLGWAGLYNFF